MLPTKPAKGKYSKLINYMYKQATKLTRKHGESKVRAVNVSNLVLEVEPIDETEV